jgi:citrate lyase beta subunit
MRAHQVAALNQGFTPTDDDTAHARSVIAAFAKERANGGTSIYMHGEIIDAARAAIAENLLAWAAACAGREQGRTTVVAQTQATARPGA